MCQGAVLKKASGHRAVVMAETGDIYIWGWNESGQLALPSRSLAEVGKTAAGEASGLKEDGCDVRTAEGTGELYTWGWGKYGQLGHKDTSSLDRPRRVEYFVDKRLQVRAVSCGPWNTYVYAVEKAEG
ncbi:rcc1 domain-containing protein [Lynx pardinus]|uniref:Rcc1 domain-containing protein n=1 Tax=Lynx pardinus TaxID=191816 RepID=A0A485P914_LYNPA|nr:rcc1 domain-containing protein [Lynx pardinus]